ncbi:MAG: site-2 protease family protein [Peptococcaceae bacterium]|nr:site-2 protease family protein [Peptococcaceae bacterium]
MFNFPNLHDMALTLPGIILGLTLHEYAHGLAAYRLGDNTARYAGRLTVNPVAHLDPAGFIMLLFAGFGWARPVPVNPANFRGDRLKGMIQVSLAGPLTNLLLAVVSAVALGFFASWRVPYLDSILFYSVQINVVLAVFNLLPIPPLDGSKVLAGLLPGCREWLYQMEAYGTIILILLIFTGVIRYLFRFFVSPVVAALIALARGIALLVS